MSSRSAFCIIPSRGHADSIIVNLRDGGFSDADVSLLFLDKSVREVTPNAPSAGPIRGVFSWVQGIQRIVVPGVGPIVIGGPVSSALMPEAVDGIRGVLVLFGIPEKESILYADQIEAGQIFASVQSTNREMVDRARGIFIAGKAESIFIKMDVVTPKLFAREVRGLPPVTAA